MRTTRWHILLTDKCVYVYMHTSYEGSLKEICYSCSRPPPILPEVVTMIFLAGTEIWTIGNTAFQPIFGVLESIMMVIMEVNEIVTYSSDRNPGLAAVCSECVAPWGYHDSEEQ